MAFGPNVTTAVVLPLVFGVIAVMGGLLTINPIWKYGPYDPSKVTADHGMQSVAPDPARVRGNPKAKVMIVEFSDFQCPYCKQFHDQSFAAIRDQYVSTGKVRMAYINYPLPSHANAWPSAEAAMCSSAQGKFWQMHDALFASQSRWEDKHPPNAVPDSVAQSGLLVVLSVSTPIIPPAR